MGLKVFAEERPVLARWSVRVGIALVIYGLVGFFIVPPIIKSQLLKRLPGLTKRQATIAQVKFNPFVLSLTIRGLALTEPDGSVFSSFDELYVNFQLSSIFRRAWVFKEISLVKPFGQVTYGADGAFNFANLADKNAPPSKGPLVLPRVMIYDLDITNGAVAFTDLTRKPAFKTEFLPIQINLTNLTTIRDKNSPYAFEARTGEGEVFAWSGNITVNPLGSSGSFRLDGISLGKYSPYTKDYSPLNIAGGLLDVAADYRFESGTNASTPDLDVSNATVRLLGLELQTPKTHQIVLKIPSLSVENASASVRRRTARIGLVKSTGGFISGRRNQDGSVDVLQHLDLRALAKIEVGQTVVRAAPTWSAKIDELRVSDYSIKLEDLFPETPANFDIDQMGFIIKGTSTESNALISSALSLRFQKTGTLTVGGNATLIPPSADLLITATNLDLRAAQPYAHEFAKLVITGGALDLQGHVVCAPSGPGSPLLSFTGAMDIRQFDTTDDVLMKDFLKWDALTLEDIKLDVRPDKLQIGRIKFAGLDTSIVVGPDRRPNLLTILQKQPAAETTTNAEPVPEHSDSHTTEHGGIAGDSRLANAAAPENEGAPAATVSTNLPDISLGSLELENASVHFSDESLEPHCSFAIQEFGGSIKGLSSRDQNPAVVDVQGKVDDRSPFSVTGKINPLGQPMTADVTVTFTNTELTAFTPYTEKYAGRPLEKGKLSLAVHYVINDQDLKAENGFFVDQLTLGPKNDSTNATKLPVKLAVALLKDRNGRIQLDVPLSGRIDDPKFRLGPIIWQVVANIIVKAATSPFSLLGAAFGGGGEELSFIQFQPGYADIPGTETNKLNVLTKALTERPALTVEINGSADAAGDREALSYVKLDQQVRAFWLKENTGAGRTPVGLDEVKLEPKEYAHWVRKLYKKDIGRFVPGGGAEPSPATNTPAVEWHKVLHPASGTNGVALPAGQFGQTTGNGSFQHGAEMLQTPSKPAALVQLPALAVAGGYTNQTIALVPGTAEFELADMKAQLARRITVTDDDLLDLMKTRANKVQAYLVETGKVPADRVFVTAPKPADASAKGQSRANLSLD